jgi:hypothetical protein
MEQAGGRQGRTCTVNSPYSPLVVGGRGLHSAERRVEAGPREHQPPTAPPRYTAWYLWRAIFVAAVQWMFALLVVLIIYQTIRMEHHALAPLPDQLSADCRTAAAEWRCGVPRVSGRDSVGRAPDGPDRPARVLHQHRVVERLTKYSELIHGARAAP